MDSEQWNQRYVERVFEHGREANLFLRRELSGLEASGRALDLACGEGRNAVWLAEQGWKVLAVDFSEVALERARELAGRRGVTLEWTRADLLAFEPPRGAFALLVIAYLHLPREGRRAVLERAAPALAPGGQLFMVGHARRNLRDGIGGPQDPAVLWDADEIAGELRELGLHVDRAEELLRPYEGDEEERTAVDVLVRAHA